MVPTPEQEPCHPLFSPNSALFAEHRKHLSTPQTPTGKIFPPTRSRDIDFDLDFDIDIDDDDDDIDELESTAERGEFLIDIDIDFDDDIDFDLGSQTAGALEQSPQLASSSRSDVGDSQGGGRLIGGANERTVGSRGTKQGER